MPEKLKKGWRTWRFDQMAVMVNDRIDNPAEAGVDRYVGLEHLDSDSLTIRRWGSPSDVEATKLRFRAGDIIFGRRRAYQRKLGVPTFDGICSAHAMVLRARRDVAAAEFLPFFMQSDLFMERAKQISVGSLSPTINWKTLAAEEFALPPLEEQRRIAEVLALADHFDESLRRLAYAASTARESWLERELTVLARMAPEKPANEVIERITVGIVVKPADLYVAPDQGIPALRSLNVAPGRLVMEDVVFISKEGHSEHAKSRLQAGDVVIVRSGRPGDAAVVPGDIGELNCIDLIICGLSPQIAPEFLCTVLNSAFGRKQFSSGSAGTAQQHFNVGAFKRFRLPVPALGVQQQFVGGLCKMDGGVAQAQARTRQSAELRKRLMEKVLLQ